MQNIEQIRLEINSVDDQILELLNKRMKFVKQIG
nr:chorismate mutase [Campylobacter sp.]